MVGDTVGDPHKDTAGPALNPMIKVVNLVSVIVAPIVVQYANPDLSIGVKVGVWVVAAALLGVLAWAVMRSKAPAPSMGAAVAVAPVSASVPATSKSNTNKSKGKKK